MQDNKHCLLEAHSCNGAPSGGNVPGEALKRKQNAWLQYFPEMSSWFLQASEPADAGLDVQREIQGHCRRCS